MGKALCRAHGTSVWAALWHASADCTLSELLRSRGNMDRWAREGAGGDLPEGGRSAGWGNGGGLGRWQRNSVVHLCRRHGGRDIPAYALRADCADEYRMPRIRLRRRARTDGCRCGGEGGPHQKSQRARGGVVPEIQKRAELLGRLGGPLFVSWWDLGDLPMGW